jgi:hypothetical protein
MLHLPSPRPHSEAARGGGAVTLTSTRPVVIIAVALPVTGRLDKLRRCSFVRYRGAVASLSIRAGRADLSRRKSGRVP